MKIKLWTINRVLRWTGFRIIVGPCKEPGSIFEIGLARFGWGFVFGGEEVNAHKHTFVLADFGE